MKSTIQLPKLLTLLVATAMFACQTPSKERILVFSKTTGFRHTSIEPGVAAIKKLGTEHGFEVLATEDAAYFTEDSLKDYSAVVFLNTTQEVLDYAQQAEFERYIQSGGGFMGIHAATDTEYDWPWYGKMVGGYFESHPKTQEAKLLVHDTTHISTSHLPKEWMKVDEWYNFKQFNSKVNVLISVDESSYEGGNMGDSHPIAWFHEYDGGRAYYTELGHTDESFSDELYLKHILGGIRYAIGDNKRNYALARSSRIPKENRFVRTVLTQNLNEPMELEMLDENRILFVERKGALKLFDLERDSLIKVAQIPVYSGQEDGLIGIAADPNYAENQWIYLMYSPVGDEAKQHVSRFVYTKENEFQMESEKVVLVVPTQRDECCHAGGSLEFGPDGNLFISVGDDTNPFASDGYAPIDERPGRTPWDAQRTSGNTNDLRGKILRIKPEADGTYSIPEGNLFPPGTPKTRPEIFVMGCRNPFRISIDQKTGFLYWGDVGPDAGKDGAERGPKGHDELNQARKAGFWGWPYTRGNNKVYFDYDFASQSSREAFNPEKIINNSPNNTGMEQLPPVQSSMIWYSYDRSEEFPWVETGGKNPMAGPVFHADAYSQFDHRFPDYFDGKLFFYEWMRDWIFIVTMDEDHRFVKADPFMPGSKFNNPIDMLFGKDGNFYILEYGEKWFAQNLDARLNKIEFVKGNRAPIARFEPDVIVGAAPLTVTFSSGSEDFDNDPMSYAWSFTGDGVESTEANPSFTFQKEGVYKVKLAVSDPSGKQTETTREIMVGNTPPEIEIKLKGGNAYYWDRKKLEYEVVVNDAEEGSTKDGGIDPEAVKVTLTYLPEGEDLVGAALGHQEQVIPKGLQLINNSDCKACHGISKKVNGPSYLQIAEKYDQKDKEYLVGKIINGGSGVWGEVVMAAHPQLSEDQVNTMVDYILGLDETPEASKRLALEGSVRLTDHIKDKDGKGRYVMMASYTDNGNGVISPINEQVQLFLTKPILQAEKSDVQSDGISVVEVEQFSGLTNLKHNTHFVFKDIQLDGVSEFNVMMGFRGGENINAKLEIREGSTSGDLLGSANIRYNKGMGISSFKLKNKGGNGNADLYFIIKNESKPDQVVGAVDYIELIF